MRLDAAMWKAQESLNVCTKIGIPLRVHFFLGFHQRFVEGFAHTWTAPPSSPRGANATLPTASTKSAAAPAPSPVARRVCASAASFSSACAEARDAWRDVRRAEGTAGVLPALWNALGSARGTVACFSTFNQSLIQTLFDSGPELGVSHLPSPAARRAATRH